MARVHFRLFSVLFVAIASVLLAGRATTGQETVALRNDIWKVAIDPGTLAVTGETASGDSLMVSDRQDASSVERLVSTASEARWDLPEKQVSVLMRLEADALRVQITASRPGDFTWPTIAASPAIGAYILPIAEGRYVPADDVDWIKELTRDPLDVYGMSLPLWGVQSGSHTLTYLVTQPFNSELAFASEGSRLSARLTHSFTPNWKVKQYELLICLGPASPIEPARRYRKWLIDQGQFVSMKQKIAHTPEAQKLLGAAHVYVWGDGWSAELMQKLADAGLDRLWLGAEGPSALPAHRDAVEKAKSLGYLVGFYDSYHSIHSPDEKDTWETAQFDQKLFDSGPIVRRDGTKRPGFKKKGFLLSPLAAAPYVHDRLTKNMAATSANSVFMDCDGFGEVFDDYSPLHLATQADDMAARVARLNFIADTFGAVVGTEGGVWYSAPAIHFAHGMTTGVIAWGDPDLTDRNSPYYLGGYYPPTGPAVFIKQVPMKDQYIKLHADPRFMLPLYETVFHDSVVVTHHWSAGTLKFNNVRQTRELLEALYNTPPLYHLNAKEWQSQQAMIRDHFAFMSPLLRQTAELAMTDFQWLSPDRMVQRTQFGNAIECIANFGDRPFEFAGQVVPPGSFTMKRLKTGETKVYTPG